MKIPAMVLALAALPMLAFAKGDTSRITLQQAGKPAVTMSAAALKEFRFGPGPGNFSGVGGNGSPAWQSRAWIVEDWEHPVAEPARTLPRLQVTFFMGDPENKDHREYVVFHVFDPAANQGYIHLPGKGEAFYDSNVFTLLRGEKYDGGWFRATPEWTQRVQAAMAAKEAGG